MSQQELVYLNGQLVPSNQASIAIYDAAVVLGATLTDMERTFNHQIFKLEQHIERFYRSCKFARIEPAESKKETKNIIEELVKHNSQLLKPNQELGCIQFISPGEFKAYAGAAGQNKEMIPTFCIHTFPLPFSLWRHYYTEGAHVVTPSIRHVPPECIDPKIKCRSRMHWWLADQDSHLVDHRAISLCLDLQGNVAETSGSNFLMYKAGTIWSPTSRNILPGVSSQFLKQLAAELGINWIEKDFQVYDVINAEEAFLASTPYCVAPVTKINGLPISNGEIGPVFKSLIRLWGERVEVNLEEQILQSKL